MRKEKADNGEEKSENEDITVNIMMYATYRPALNRVFRREEHRQE